MSALFPPIACIKAVKTSPLYPIYYKNYSAVAPSTPLTPQKHQQVLPLLLMNNLPLKYECSWHGCDQIFSSEDESYAHLVETHSLIGKQVCKWDKHGGGICNTHLRHRSQLIEHIITHFSLAVRPYPCKEENCHEKFRSRQRLAMHLRSVHRNNINNNSGSSGSLSVTRRRSSSSSSSDQQLFRRTSEPYPTASALAANFSATSFATFGGGRRTRSGDLAFGFNNIQIMSSSVGIVDQSTSVLDVSSSGAIVPSPSLTCGSSSSSSSANSAGNSHTSPYSSHGTILQSNSSFIDSTLSVHLQLGHHNMMPIAQPAASTLNTITPSSSSSPLPPHSYTPSITSSSASSTYSSLASVAADDESCTLGSACHTYATITSSLFSADTLPPRKKSPLLESSIDSSINTSVDDGGEEQQSTHHAVYTAAELLEIFNF